MKKLITQAELKELMTYDGQTGRLSWKIARPVRRLKNGRRKPNAKGYLSARVKGRDYGIHRLVWLYVHGEFPVHGIDHINHKKDDNRIENLRDVTIRENGRNLEMSKKNKSGFTGVRQEARSGKWSVTICVNGKVLYLGLFPEKILAIAARIKANELYGFHKNHGKKSYSLQS